MDRKETNPRVASRLFLLLTAMLFLTVSCATTMYQYYDQEVDEKGNPIEWSGEDRAMKERVLHEAFLFEDFEDKELEAPLMVENPENIQNGVLTVPQESGELVAAIDDPDIDFQEIIVCCRLESKEAQLFLTTNLDGREPHLFLDFRGASAGVLNQEGMKDLSTVSSQPTNWNLQGLRIKNGSLEFRNNGQAFASFSQDVPEYLESVFLSHTGEGSIVIDYIILKGVRVQNTPAVETPEEETAG